MSVYTLRQQRAEKFRRALVIGLLLACMLSGCGKRANHIDPPPEVEEDRFPQTYPDPATDPAPVKPAP